MINQHKAVMLCRFIESLFILLVALLAGSMGSLAAPGGNGVDDLRGQWEFTVIGLNSQPLDLTVFLNDLGPDPNNRENFYVAAGCLQTAGSNATAPLSMQAIDQGNGQYALTMLSTVVPASQGQPFVVRFAGTAITYNRGVNNDEASGTVSASFANGNWGATHHDRRRTDCPAVEIPPLSMRGDVGALIQYQGYYQGHEQPVVIKTGYEVQTDIPAALARVKLPDGTTRDIQPLTDFLITPEFHEKFVFQTPFDKMDAGYPVVNGVYQFTLLDAFGREIAGATARDSWTACTVPPPGHITLSLGVNGVLVNWDAVNPSGPDQFGMYSIQLRKKYGDNSILYSGGFIPQATAPAHLIPYAFEPGAKGTPSGYDFGVSLDKLPSGATFEVEADAYTIAAGNTGWECHTNDLAERVEFIKNNDGSIIIP